MTRLGQRAETRDNHFNLIRMLAALAVLVSHAWPIALGPGAVDPLERLTGLSLGFVAVQVFFAISGFLVARSWGRAAGPGDWLAARALRILPGLGVMLALSVLLLGPALGTLSLVDYLRTPQTALYFARNLTLIFPDYALPGVFASVPYAGAVNGSLWTLAHEAGAYAMLMAFCVGGGLSGGRRMLPLRLCALAGVMLLPAVLAAAESAGLPVPGRAEAFAGLLLPFGFGVALHAGRHRVWLAWRWAALLAALAAAASGTVLFAVLLAAALAYGVLCAAYLPRGRLLRYNRLGDYSYGVYIYAFPVQQAAMQLARPESPLANIALAMPVTLLLAVLSWRLVEKPALGLRRRASRGLVASLPGAIGGSAAG